MGAGQVQEFADGMGFAGGYDVIVRGFGLQHHPHGFDIIAGIAPIAFGVEVAEEELLLQPQLDAAERAGNLAGDEGFAAALRFVIEENAVADEQAIGFAVIDGIPVSRDFADGIGTARIKRRGFALRRMGGAEHFRGAGLVEARLLLGSGGVVAQGFQDTERSGSYDIGGVFGLIEADAHVGLGREVVDFIGLNLFEDVAQAGAVRHIAIMQAEGDLFMRIRIDGVQAIGVEGGSAADHAVHLVAFGQQEFGQERTILPGNTENERSSHLENPIINRIEAIRPRQRFGGGEAGCDGWPGGRIEGSKNQIAGVGIRCGKSRSIS